MTLALPPVRRQAPRSALGLALCRGLRCAVGAAAVLMGCAPVTTTVREGPAPRVVVVERAPAGGLAYRLIRAEGAAGQRLVVWMHPSGGSMNARVEALAPELARRGFALLMPIGKQFMKWTGREANQLLGVTVPDAASLPGIDGRRPILMGFSAGGQAALLLWAAAPGRIGGLALCGTAPLLAEGERLLEMAPPEAAGAARTPVRVVVGALEPSAWLWEEQAGRWEGAGVRLTVRVVPGEGHAMLLDRQARGELLRWLEERGAKGR